MIMKSVKVCMGNGKYKNIIPRDSPDWDNHYDKSMDMRTDVCKNCGDSKSFLPLGFPSCPSCYCTQAKENLRLENTGKRIKSYYKINWLRRFFNRDKFECDMSTMLIYLSGKEFREKYSVEFDKFYGKCNGVCCR